MSGQAGRGRITALAVDPTNPNRGGTPLTFTHNSRATGLSRSKLGLKTPQGQSESTAVVRNFTISRKLLVDSELTQPGLGLQTQQAARGAMHLPAMTARVPTMSAPRLR